MKRLFLFFPILLSMTAFAAGPSAPPSDPTGVDYLHDIVIGHGGNRTLHAELARPSVPSAKPFPAVVFIHGGGWMMGSQKKLPLFLVGKGYAMASIEYRLSGEAKWPAQIEDCKLGIRWLRANAAKYNIDPGRIACWGISAGGHLVACLGTMNSPALEGTGGYPGVSSRVQAVIDASGPTDFRSGNFGNGSKTIDKAGLDRDLDLEEELLGPLAKNADLWRQASPITWVHPGDPPFLIIHGENDAVVAPQQATTFAAALKKAGVPVQVLIIKNGIPQGHAIKGGTPDQTGEIKVMTDFLDKYLKK